MVKLGKCLPEGVKAARVLAKLEMCNPGGSLKDGIALQMIETAEKQVHYATLFCIKHPTDLALARALTPAPTPTLGHHQAGRDHAGRLLLGQHGQLPTLPLPEPLPLPRAPAPALALTLTLPLTRLLPRWAAPRGEGGNPTSLPRFQSAWLRGSASNITVILSLTLTLAPTAQVPEMGREPGR